MDAPRIIDHKLIWKSQPLPRRQTLGLVVHHTTGDPRTETVESIHAYHRDKRGWNGIGYNYMIYADGSIHLGRPDGTVGAHCSGSNSTHAGVALSGHFGRSEPTAAQIESSDGKRAMGGVRELAEALGLTVDVKGWPRVVVS